MKVYIVDERSWSMSVIKKVFLDKRRAQEYAKQEEMLKIHSDGYQSFYVTEYEIEE